jgi:hypothetical protein
MMPTPNIQWKPIPFFGEKKWDGQYRVVERTHNSGRTYYVSQYKYYTLRGASWRDASDHKHDDIKDAINQCQRLFDGDIKSERTVAE